MLITINNCKKLVQPSITAKSHLCSVTRTEGAHVNHTANDTLTRNPSGNSTFRLQASWVSILERLIWFARVVASWSRDFFPTIFIFHFVSSRDGGWILEEFPFLHRFSYLEWKPISDDIKSSIPGIFFVSRFLIHTFSFCKEILSYFKGVHLIIWRFITIVIFYQSLTIFKFLLGWRNQQPSRIRVTIEFTVKDSNERLSSI